MTNGGGGGRGQVSNPYPKVVKAGTYIDEYSGTAVARSGEYSLVTRRAASGGEMAMYLVTEVNGLTPGKRYRASAYALNTANKDGRVSKSQIFAGNIDADPSTVRETTSGFVNQPYTLEANGEWNLLTVEFTAGEEREYKDAVGNWQRQANYIGILSRASGTSAGFEDIITVFWDDISIEEIEDALPAASMQAAGSAEAKPISEALPSENNSEAAAENTALPEENNSDIISEGGGKLTEATNEDESSKLPISQ